jgi:hypothetical protein
MNSLAFSASLYLCKGEDIVMMTTVSSEDQIRTMVSMFDKAFLAGAELVWLKNYTVIPRPTCESTPTVRDDAGGTDSSFYDPWHARSSGGRDVGAYITS